MAGSQPGTLSEAAVRLHSVGTCGALKALGPTQKLCQLVDGIIALKLFADCV